MTAPRFSRILVAGAGGMVGSAICRALASRGIDHVGATRRDADFRDRPAVDRLIANVKPDCIIVAAAKVGGIQANNTYPADFILENLQIEANLIDGAFRAGIDNVLFLGSSCIYPKLADQPIKEEALLTGILEPTNEPYAIAKIAGIKLCESFNRQFGTDYRSLMPTNLYGPGDNFHPEHSHVIPGLMQRLHVAKLRGDATVGIWGTGSPRREFLHVDDLADAVVHLGLIAPEQYWSRVEPMMSHVNVGVGEDVAIRDLARMICDAMDYAPEFRFDTRKPDGTPRKLLDVSKLQGLGWKARIPLDKGIEETYKWYLSHVHAVRQI